MDFTVFLAGEGGREGDESLYTPIVQSRETEKEDEGYVPERPPFQSSSPSISQSLSRVSLLVSHGRFTSRTC